MQTDKINVFKGKDGADVKLTIRPVGKLKGRHNGWAVEMKSEKSPEDTRRLLQDATPVLLVPFQPSARQEDDSIFTSGMGIAEKMEVYSETLEKRIAVAKAAETRVALRLMRDHVLQAAAQLRDDSGQPSEES